MPVTLETRQEPARQKAMTLNGREGQAILHRAHQWTVPPASQPARRACGLRFSLRWRCGEVVGAMLRRSTGFVRCGLDDVLVQFGAQLREPARRWAFGFQLILGWRKVRRCGDAFQARLSGRAGFVHWYSGPVEQGQLDLVLLRGKRSQDGLAGPGLHACTGILERLRKRTLSGNGLAAQLGLIHGRAPVEETGLWRRHDHAEWPANLTTPPEFPDSGPSSTRKAVSLSGAGASPPRSPHARKPRGQRFLWPRPWARGSTRPHPG